ncbi:hypothetical protein FIU86_09730 [Roseovarius sp. THAF9]|uniref:hypothetical protein n=1 Tax=Roseovarius sp. THAF9 TaxID=2587847 RepID=UPI001268EC3A|nr:hypothetical protein [Roseovarius sp. THAF9]QFT93124.1 hypothetical protein FIU86_09730 [Roseovarius sp. THAF9]
MADAMDPKGLIRESYRIEGITPAECRSIFLDWALSVDGDGDTRVQIERLIERYGVVNPDHPMTAVLHEGLKAAGSPKRRGGSRGRVR